MIITKDLIKTFIDKNGNLNYNYYKNYDINIPLNYTSLSEYLYCIYYDIKETPKCKICNNKVKFKNFKLGYEEFCSAKCKNKIYKKIQNKKNYKKFLLEEKSIEWFLEKQNIKYLSNFHKKTTTSNFMK